MDLHQNARLTFRSRGTLANKVMHRQADAEGGWAGGPGFGVAGIAQNRVPRPSRSLRRAGVGNAGASLLIQVAS